MQAVLYANQAEHQIQAAELMAAGLRRHGITTVIADDKQAQSADLVVMWGYRQRHLIKAARDHNIPVLAMERGCIPPRMEWTSCGFNGMGWQAIYPKASDDGARWHKNFAYHLHPWRTSGAYTLVCGQPATTDANALHGPEIHQWAQMVIDRLREQGHAVRFRAHPHSILVGDPWLPERVEISTRSIQEDLAEAEFAVVYNSAACVEAVLAGVPTVTYDSKAMAWPVTTHHVDEKPIMPDRTSWCHDLAWTQWLPEEIQQGITWDVIKSLSRDKKL